KNQSTPSSSSCSVRNGRLAGMKRRSVAVTMATGRSPISDRSRPAASRAPSSYGAFVLVVASIVGVCAIPPLSPLSMHPLPEARLTSRIFTREAVCLLNLAHQLVAPALDLAQRVVGVPSPLLLDPA